MAAMQIQRNIGVWRKRFRGCLRSLAIAKHGPQDTVCNDIPEAFGVFVSRQISIDCSEICFQGTITSHIRELYEAERQFRC